MTRRPARVGHALIALLLAAELISACGEVFGDVIVAEPSEIGGGAGGAEDATGGEGGAATGTGGSNPEGGTAGTTSSGGVTTMGGAVNGGSGAGSGGSPDGGTTMGGAGGSAGSSGNGGSSGQTNCPAPKAIGYAAEAGGISGGQAGTVVKVSTMADLKKYATFTDPYIIQIDSLITLTEQIRPKSDKTILGVGKNAELTGGGLYIIGVHNVIVQNLKISKALNEDAIGIQASQHVWIDHCDLSSDRTSPKGTYDDLVAVTHGSDYVTVSWTHFHDHDGVSLVGHTSDPSALEEDPGHLTVTYHHNWFHNTLSNNPRVRFGKVHVFNNLFQDVGTNAVISQMGAQVFVERNSFQNVSVPITTVYQDPEEGTVTEQDNLYSPDCGPNQITLPATWVPPYTYRDEYLDLTSTAEIFVPSCAGVGKI